MQTTLRDFMQGHAACSIICAAKGAVMRRIVVTGETADISAPPHEIGIPLDTPLEFEPWAMDRGSILFRVGETLCKLCTVLSTVEMVEMMSEVYLYLAGGSK